MRDYNGHRRRAGAVASPPHLHSGLGPDPAGGHDAADLHVVNRALFELLLGGVRFDSAAPEDVVVGYAYRTGYFMAFGGMLAATGV